MARYHKQRNDVPMGTVSSGTMRLEDLIPAFVYELQYRRRNKHGLRRHHMAELRAIEKRMEEEGYFESDDVDNDYEWLFSALEEYAGPHFYFGSHPGDGSDYGYWLPEGFDQDFDGLKVSDLSEIPAKYRGEVLHVNDHGNVSLYVKTCRTLREVWAVV